MRNDGTKIDNDKYLPRSCHALRSRSHLAYTRSPLNHKITSLSSQNTGLLPHLKILRYSLIRIHTTSLPFVESAILYSVLSG